MGNLIGKEKDNPHASRDSGSNPQEALTPARIFEIKSQFLECWTTRDVVEWLHFLSLPEFTNLTEELLLDGDALILLASALRKLSENSNKNQTETNSTSAQGNSTTNETNETLEHSSTKEKEEIGEDQGGAENVLPAMLQVIQKFKITNKDDWPVLVAKIKGLVDFYESQMGSGKQKDEEFPPYDYPTFPTEEPKNRNVLVQFYHENTQHTKQQGSRSVERRWFSQPRIYKRFFGAPYFKLPLPRPLEATPTPYNALFFAHPPSVPPHSLSLASLSEFLFYSLSVSGRRDMWTLTSSPRSAWVKRVNPSSGGLHPIECYIVLPGGISDTPATSSSSTTPTHSSSPSTTTTASHTTHNHPSSPSSTHTLSPSPSVYHYALRHHGLELRSNLRNGVWEKLGLREGCFIVGLSSIHWREVWKYGERGFRYSMLDSGHAYGSIAISAARLGWKITLLPHLETEFVEALLGISDSNKTAPAVERERGLILGIVDTTGSAESTTSFPDLSDLQDQIWEGTPNRLSSDHKEWDIVSMVDRVTTVDKIDAENSSSLHVPTTNELPSILYKEENEAQKGKEDLADLSKSASLETVIISRRSALDYIDRPISLGQFVHIMYSILASNVTVKFSWPELASLFIFAYNVDSLASGIYVLVRNSSELEELKSVTAGREFKWTVPECAPSLPLYLLKEIPREELAKHSYVASCNQHIASKGAFSLGMFVNIQKVMEIMGPSGYCRAHLECGALGQVLYLEAHALGLGATGMGCYLDDLSRNTFGLTDSPFWPLYHFAVGVPSKDDRYAPYDYHDNMFAGVLEECVEVMKPRK